MCLNFYAYSVEVNYKVLARSSETDSYKMPVYSPLRGVTPQINDENNIAFKIPTNDMVENEKIFFNTSKKSTLIYAAPANTFVSDPIIASDGILFTLNDVGGTKFLLKYIFKTKKVQKILEPSKSELSIIYEFHQNEEAIYFRAKDKNGNLGIYSVDLENKETEVKTLFKTGQKVQGKKISYIFALDMNGQYGVCKVRFTHLQEDAPDLIVRLNLKSSEHRIIAADKDFSRRSRYISFRNSTSINKHGGIAFIVEEKTKTKIMLNHLEKNNTTKEIARTSKKIKSISHFAPDITDSEIIIFRGKDSRDREVLYIANSEKIRKIVRQYQVIKTDKKKRAVLMHTKTTPVFGGNPRINNLGTIVINSSIRHLDQYTNEPKDIQSAIIGVYDAPSLLLE